MDKSVEYVKERNVEKFQTLYCRKNELERILDAMGFASDQGYFSLLEVCRQIVKEMYELFYD